MTLLLNSLHGLASSANVASSGKVESYGGSLHCPLHSVSSVVVLPVIDCLLSNILHGHFLTYAFIIDCTEVVPRKPVVYFPSTFSNAI